MAPRKKKKTGKSKDPEPKKFASDMEMLDHLKQTIMDQVKQGKISLKVGDLLKIVEIQRKLSSDSRAEEKFWEMIEQIRQTELEKE